MSGDQKARQVISGEFLGALETLDLYIKGAMRGHFGGSRRSNVYGSSPEFADYRDYTPGDDLRRIDWNLVGRFDKYYIKQFIDERQLQAHIYLDMSASMDYGDDGKKGLAALRLAAAAGFLAVQSMDRVAYRLLAGDKCTDLCGTLMGRESFYGASEKLARLRFSGDADLHLAIRNDASPGYDNGMSLIISDFLTESDWKGAVDYLLSRHREVALIQILSPDEMDPQCNGQIHFLDAEAETEADARNMRLEVNRGALKAYRQALAYYLDDMKNFCASRNVAFLTVHSEEKIEDIILSKGFAAGLIQ